MGNNINRFNEAVVVFNSIIHNNISGTVIFKQYYNGVQININLIGLNNSLTDGLHGFHIHESGDLRDGCDSCCAHYNPTNVNHGGLEDGHLGDLGNITVVNNRCKQILFTNKFKIDEIIGRSLIIHEDEDDLGKKNNKISKVTGNSGKRLCCQIIGISKNALNCV